jgi:hypothetical protein
VSVCQRSGLESPSDSVRNAGYCMHSSKASTLTVAKAV